jgi:adenine-specific DNA-methyltransferase
VFEYQGMTFAPGMGTFKTDLDGMKRLAVTGRLHVSSKGKLNYRRFRDDFALAQLGNLWTDISGAVQSRSDPKVYAVQTSTSIVQRCLLMTTDPGDLVLDPTCGSGTTAYVAEQWGRRWITIDTSRVPLALARQRLLSATYPYYELQDPALGPAGGFVYKRKQNSKREEVGGIVPHVTLKSIANNEPPKEEVLVDRPEEDRSIVRVTGPFCVEATIPTPVDWEGDGVEDSGALSAEEYGSFVDRMIEVLRKSPLLRLEGNRTVTLKNIRPPAKTLSLSAEALVEGELPGKSMSLDETVQIAAEKSGKVLSLSAKPVALVFGPENGAVSEKLVYEAAREAYAKNYAHLFVFGFAIQPNARKLIEEAEAVMGVSASYVQATPDLMMGDLLKNMRSSQIFSVCGLPEVRLRRIPLKVGGGAPAPGDVPGYQVELLGLDVFDPITMQVDHVSGNDVPAWFLDTDYNGLCFHVSQAFFPRTSAWDSLKRALKGEYEDSVWEHLAGAQSAPFEAGEHGQIAVKVIDQRGNELLVVKSLKEAQA